MLSQDRVNEVRLATRGPRCSFESRLFSAPLNLYTCLGLFEDQEVLSRGRLRKDGGSVGTVARDGGT